MSTDMPKTTSKENRDDHDLLISMKSEFGTKLDRVIDDVAALSNNLVGKVEKLEIEKATKQEIEDIKREQAVMYERHEVQIDLLKGWRWYVIGITTALVMVGGYIFQVVLN